MALPPLLLRSGRRLFSPSQHWWIRARDTLICEKGMKTHVLELGLSHRGVEDIGDIQSIRLEQQQRNVRAGQDLLRVLWEGHSISGADELHHTSWESVEGSTILKSPIAGTVQEADIENPWIDADDCLLRMTASEKDVFAAFSKLVCENACDNKVIKNMPPGRFGERVNEEVGAILQFGM